LPLWLKHLNSRTKIEHLDSAANLLFLTSSSSLLFSSTTLFFPLPPLLGCFFFFFLKKNLILIFFFFVHCHPIESDWVSRSVFFKIKYSFFYQFCPSTSTADRVGVLTSHPSSCCLPSCINLPAMHQCMGLTPRHVNVFIGIALVHQICSFTVSRVDLIAPIADPIFMSLTLIIVFFFVFIYVFSFLLLIFELMRDSFGMRGFPGVAQRATRFIPCNYRG
jgi:hypothetical protein